MTREQRDELMHLVFGRLTCGAPPDAYVGHLVEDLWERIRGMVVPACREQLTALAQGLIDRHLDDIWANCVRSAQLACEEEALARQTPGRIDIVAVEVARACGMRIRALKGP